MGDTLLWAVKNGDLDAIKKCIDKPGFNVNSELLNGRNALHYAADYGQAEVVSLLLNRNANVNIPDKFGITALLAAIYEGHASVVEVLLKNGADRTGKAPDGSSYLACAETDDIKELLK